MQWIGTLFLSLFAFNRGDEGDDGTESPSIAMPPTQPLGPCETTEYSEDGFGTLAVWCNESDPSQVLMSVNWDWTNWVTDQGYGIFECFDNETIAAYRELYKVTDTELELNSGTYFHSEDWGFGSVAVSIILQEIFGFNISMSTFYYEGVDIIENSYKFRPGWRIPFFHLEQWAGDMEHDLYSYPSDNIDLSLMGVPYFWVLMIKRAVLEQIEAEIGDGVTFLDVWRTFLDPAVVAKMARPDDIDIQDGDLCDASAYMFEGYEGSSCYYDDTALLDWGGVAGSVLVNGTYYPPQCPVDDHDHCMVMMAWLPGYSLSLHADLIAQFNLNWVVKYLGSEVYEGQNVLGEMYENDTRVLFEVWTPSISTAADWIKISVPIDHPFSAQDQIFRALSSRMRFISKFAYHLIGTGFLMTTSDFEWAFKEINQDSGLQDWDHFPYACQWLKEHEETWHNWIDINQRPETDTLCNQVTDDTLQKLLKYRDYESKRLEEEVMTKGEDMFVDLDSSMEDLYTIQYALGYCIQSYDGSEDGLFLMLKVLSALGFASMVILGIAILWFKDHQIMIASSESMCCVLIVGGLIGLCFPFLSDSESTFSCYARPFVIQIGLTLMCGSIMVKTWRLNKYIVAAKQYQVPQKISDPHCVLRILLVVAVVVLYLAIMMAVFPMTVGDEVVIDGVIFPQCLWSDEFKIGYQILVALQTLKLALVAMDAWNLRNIGQQFNESKFIGIILYHNVVLVGFMLVVDELKSLNPNVRFVITNLLVTVLVFIISFVLLIPKFINIYRGVEYSEKMSIFASNADSDQLVIKKSQMSKVDILKIKKLLKSYGYDVVKRKSANDSAQFGLLELSSRSPSSMSRRSKSTKGRKPSKEQPLVGITERNSETNLLTLQ